MRDPEAGTELQGFYLKIRDDWVGMYISADGPKFFVNKRVFPLNGTEWDMELFVGKEDGMFTFYWNGESIVSAKLSEHLDRLLRLHDEASASRATAGTT